MGAPGLFENANARARKHAHNYSLRGSNPRPMAHKTIALTTELRERLSQHATAMISEGCRGTLTLQFSAGLQPSRGKAGQLAITVI